jgi:hypothetical protein
MKIKRVAPWNVTYPEPNDSNNIRYLTFCSIEADDGTVGWGMLSNRPRLNNSRKFSRPVHDTPWWKLLQLVKA